MERERGALSIWLYSTDATYLRAGRTSQHNDTTSTSRVDISLNLHSVLLISRVKITDQTLVNYDTKTCVRQTGNI